MTGSWRKKILNIPSFRIPLSIFTWCVKECARKPNWIIKTKSIGTKPEKFRRVQIFQFDLLTYILVHIQFNLGFGCLKCNSMHIFPFKIPNNQNVYAERAQIRLPKICMFLSNRNIKDNGAICVGLSTLISSIFSTEIYFSCWCTCGQHDARYVRSFCFYISNHR